jgi:response regulator RpfG family c-di-GMP phosphodiesterase
MASQEQTVEARTPKPNVLAVDDTPANLLSLEAVLENDYNVVRAGSGAEAIAMPYSAGGATST